MGKYYSVYMGKSGVPKILTSWEECKKEVIGCKGAIYKSFKTELEAIEFLSMNSKGKDEINSLNSKSGNENSSVNDKGLIIYVDGSFSLEKGNYSYGLIAIEDGNEIYRDCGAGVDPDAIALRNVAGEVLGALKAVEYAIDRGYKEVRIAYDYQGIECWALGTWKRNKELTEAYHKSMQENMKKINIKFIKIKGHSGDKYNDIADKLAKKALEIIS